MNKIDWKNRRYCEQLSVKDVDENVFLNGFVDTIRDHGGILFIHLRDISGFIQLVFDPDILKETELINTANSIRSEFVLSVSGKVLKRSEENINPSVPTGSIEVHVQDFEILSKAETPPFMVTEKETVKEDSVTRKIDEDLRLQYRYLDLRRPSMQQNLLKRSKITHAIRSYLEEKEFFDIETPVLTKSTPEGARDYIVPSRHHLGRIYALPQSPQLFKQLLMMSGLERYYQIVKCFRDEDLRPNRQPEFTQLDLEAAFIDETFIIDLIEGLLVKAFAVEGITLNRPFLQLDYETAMDKYGSDKPDLRPGMEMITVTSIFKDCNYKIFNSIVNNGGLIKAIVLKNKASELSKNMLQNEWASKVIQKCGGKGLSWMKVENGALQSNIVQFFTEDEQKELMTTLKVEDNDVILMVADTSHKTVLEVLGRFRLYVAETLNLSNPDEFIPCWVTNFPLFELKDGKITSMHHPFTQPDRELPSADDHKNLCEVKSRAYDIAVNGEEIGGGSIRIHDTNVQKEIFSILGLSESETEEKFGFFTKALTHGAPPHGGIALGIDRLVSMILKTPSIREVIAFPKNRVAFCPLTQAPSKADSAQLQELNMTLREEESN